MSSFKQILKTGLAAACAMWLAAAIHSAYPLYAMLAVIVTMRTTLAGSLRSGGNRIAGTAVGCIAGAVFLHLMPVNPLTIGVGVAVTLAVAGQLPFSAAREFSAILFVLTMLQHPSNPWFFAWHRFLDTTLGIAVAFAFNALLWPQRPWRLLRTALAQLLRDLEELYALCCSGYIRGEPLPERRTALADQIRAALPEIDQLHQDARKEPFGQFRVEETAPYLVRRIFQHVLVMDQVAAASGEDRAGKDLAGVMEPLDNATREGFLCLAAAAEHGNMRVDLTTLGQRAEAATAGFLEARSGFGDRYGPEEILRFGAYFYSMQEVAQKLSGLELALNPSVQEVD